MLLFSFLFNAILGFGLYIKHKLTLSGSIAAFLLGFIVLGFGHPLFYVLMMSFLFSSLLINKVILRFIPNIKNPQKDHEPRRWINVLANGSLLGVASLLYVWFPSPWVIALGIISMAASTADTWASEIGSCSLQTPWTLIKRQPIQTGLSGGVTWLGLYASLFGSMFISALSLPIIIQTFGFNILSFGLFVLFTLAGFGGSLVDSILGELFQAKFENASHEIVEVLHHSTDRLISGVTWMDNHMVNFLSNVITISIFTPLFQTIIR
jgi:uncharacterized protein (TIGR00297 family)